MKEKNYFKKPVLGVSKNYAEEIRNFVNKLDLIDKLYHVSRKNNYVFFPLKKPLSEKEISDIRNITNEFILTEKEMLVRGKIFKIKEVVNKIKEKKLISKVPFRYLSLNGIVIAEIEEEFEKDAIEYFLLIKKNIEAIYKIDNLNFIYKGIKPQLIFGQEISEYKFKEKDIIIQFNFTQFIPDPRLMLFIRKISNEITFGELIAEIGATTGYTSILIAKKFQNTIYAFEENLSLYFYLLQNIKLNNVEKFVFPVYLNTLNFEIKYLNGRFDRIIISKPHNYLEMLNLALQLIKNKGKLCLFAISKEEDYLDVKINLEEKLQQKGCFIQQITFKKVLNLFINEYLVYSELTILKE
jgi:tRNA G37 N-methylase Trm5